MQKPKDPDIDLIANFIQMAGRYLEGGVRGPKFKSIVAWALQNISLLERELIPNSTPSFGDFLVRKARKAAMEIEDGEELRKKLNELMVDGVKSKLMREYLKENNLPPKHFDALKKQLERNKERIEEKHLPLEIRDEVFQIISHIRTDGKLLDYAKKNKDNKIKWFAVHDESLEKMIEDAQFVTPKTD